LSRSLSGRSSLMTAHRWSSSGRHFPMTRPETSTSAPKGRHCGQALYHSASGLFGKYWAEKKDCVACFLRGKCLSETDRHGARKLSDSYFKPSVRRRLSRRKKPACQEALKQRQIWCEGTFAVQKRMHNLTCVLQRGLEAAEDHCLLLSVMLNLKRMIWAMK